MSSSAGVLDTRSLKASRGAAANRTCSALSTLRCNSATAHLAGSGGLLLQARKKGGHLAPDLRAARKPSPVSTDQTHEFVAFVDRSEIILVAICAATCAHTIGKQRDDVGFDATKHGIGLDNVLPGVEWQQGLDGAGRARITSNHPGSRAAVEEESQFDGNAQAVPLRVC